MIKKKFYHNEVCLIKLPKFKDQRGYFMEVFQEKKLKKILSYKKFVQFNHSCSKKNVLRGMHFQIGRSSQGKLIRVTKGSIYDVIVNLDKKSKYFGEYLTFNIKNNNELLWVPRKYAHGYLSLENDTEIQYFCDNYYRKEKEKTLIWNDEDISINWPDKKKFLVSKKYKKGEKLKNLMKFL